MGVLIVVDYVKMVVVVVVMIVAVLVVVVLVMAVAEVLVIVAGTTEVSAIIMDYSGNADDGGGVPQRPLLSAQSVERQRAQILIAVLPVTPRRCESKSPECVFV
jgi:hypothetical protein